ELQHKAEELQQNLGAAEDDILTQPPATAREGIAGFFGLFIPRKDYFITPILVDLNILLFIAMVSTGVDIMLPDSESLLWWGANFRPATLNGEWWRLITCCFLHIGIIHLLMNMYALVYIGLLLEPYLGRTRFTAAYLLTGITASVASLWWHDNTVSAGASGAIFGMYGVFLAMLTTNLIEKEARTALLTSIGIFVVYNLASGMKGGIDNAAHLGGLAGGLVMGYLFVFSLKRPEAQPLKYLTIAIPALLFAVLTVGAINYIPNTMGIYQQKMKDFGAMEEKALAAYELPESATYEQKAVAFRDSGLYYWNKNLALLHEVEQLDLPVDYRLRNEKLLEYTELRIGSYTAIAKMYEENTNEYDTEIEYYNTQLGIVLDSLNVK
ncbi:MAG: rhomboid family intramembrane serine protease, partial [Bacteroidota bacterium]